MIFKLSRKADDLFTQNNIILLKWLTMDKSGLSGCYQTQDLIFISAKKAGKLFRASQRLMLNKHQKGVAIRIEKFGISQDGECKPSFPIREPTPATSGQFSWQMSLSNYILCCFVAQ